MKRRWRRLLPVNQDPGGPVGAGYMAALLAGDDFLIACYRQAFSPDELLDAVAAPIKTLGRYLAYHEAKTPTEVGDALVRAYRHLSKEPS